MSATMTAMTETLAALNGRPPAAQRRTAENARASWPPWAPAVLEAMRSLPSVSRASKVVGIGRRTIYDLAQRDESFASAMHEAREEGLDAVEEVCFLRARTGQPVNKVVTRQLADGSVETTTTQEQRISDNLAMFYLKRYRPEFRDNYPIENSGPAASTIRINTERVDREIRSLLDELEG